MFRAGRLKLDVDRVQTLIVALAVAWLYVALNDPMSRQIRSWYNGTGIAPDLPINASIDDVVHAAMPTEGNAVLDLPALVREPGVPPESVGRILARGTYALWPRRFYTVEPGNVVVWAHDMRDMATPADPQWLADHDVRQYARIRFNPVRLHIAPVITTATSKPAPSPDHGQP